MKSSLASRTCRARRREKSSRRIRRIRRAGNAPPKLKLIVVGPFSSTRISKSGERVESAKARSKARDSTQKYSEGRARTRQSYRPVQPILKSMELGQLATVHLP